MHKIKRRSIRCSLMILLVTNVGLVFAAENEVDEQVLSALEEEVLWLREETYVTTATKTFEDIKKSGSTVSVISADELKSMGARNLMDALKRLPGLGINQFNIGMPAVEVRGVKTDFGEKVLFLINGHPTNNNLVNGGATWSYENFNVDEVQRVEVVRGPGSALYGANAFVAVINIITKKAEDIDGAIVTVGGGSYDTKEVNVQIGQEVGEFDVAVNFNVLDTDGIRGEVASDALGASGKVDSWDRRYDLGFNMKYGNTAFQGKYVQRNSGSFAGITNTLNDGSEQQYLEYFMELAHSRSLSQNLSVMGKIYYDHFEADNFWELFPPGFAPGYPNGMLGRTPVTNERLGGELQTEVSLGTNHKALAGIMLERQSQFDVKHYTNFDPFTGAPTGVYEDVSDKWNWNGSHDRDIRAVFVQDIWDIQDDLRFIGGARYDDYSDFGGTFNPRLSLTWGFIENYSLITTYGSAFRAPTFGELYNINNPSIIGNPDVQPEEIETFEFGVNGDITKRTSLRTTWFRNDITNLIAPTPSGNAVNVSGNVGKLKVDGIEFEISSRLRDGSSVALNYTYQHPVNELTHQRAPDVPLHKANASFNYRHSKNLDGFIGLLYRGSLSRAEGDPRPDVADYITVDLAVTWKNYIENLEVQASVYNLSDEHYVDPSPSGVMVSDYPKAGRNFMVDVSYKL